MIKTIAIGLFLLLISFSACKKQVAFNKQEFLENTINNYVLASNEELLQAANGLKTSTNQFLQTPNTPNLQQVQAAWKNTMNAWSVVEGLNFGPGRTQYRYLQLDNTPVRTASIEAALLDSTFIDLVYVRQRGSYTKGLATIEYLLFEGTGDHEIVVRKYLNGMQGAQRQAYLQYSVEHVLELIAALTLEWETSYAQELANLTDNGSTGGIARFSNVLLHLTQTIARKKIGKPLGKESSTGMVQPQLVESPYAHHSWEMIHYNLIGLQRLFGKEEQGMGSYLKNLLGDATNTNKIAAQFAKVVNLTKNRSISLQMEVTNQVQEVEEIYEEMKMLYQLLQEDYLPYVSITLLTNPDDGD